MLARQTRAPFGLLTSSRTLTPEKRMVWDSGANTGMNNPQPSAERSKPGHFRESGVQGVGVERVWGRGHSCWQPGCLEKGMGGGGSLFVSHRSAHWALSTKGCPLCLYFCFFPLVHREGRLLGAGSWRRGEESFAPFSILILQPILPHRLVYILEVSPLPSPPLLSRLHLLIGSSDV